MADKTHVVARIVSVSGAEMALLTDGTVRFTAYLKGYSKGHSAATEA